MSNQHSVNQNIFNRQKNNLLLSKHCFDIDLYQNGVSQIPSRIYIYMFLIETVGKF